MAREGGVLNQERYAESKEWLDNTLSDSANRNVPLIVCFHKLDMPDAKKYLPDVKAVFKREEFLDRPVHFLETTIFNQDSILALKTLFVKIIEEEI